MTTPADELRAAAEKLRELAAKATTGICPDWIYSAVRHVARNCQIECSHGEHQDWDQPQWDRYADWPYIAAMHPGVGALVAKSLERNAGRAQEIQDHLGDEFQDGALDQDIHDALAVARALNGTTS